MKKVMILLSFFLLSNAKKSIAQTWQWASKLESSLGPLDKIVIKGVDVDASDNSYVTGYYNGNFGTAITTSSGQDGFIAKFNTSGTLLWVTKFGGIGNDAGNAISVETGTPGAVYITGYVQYNDPASVTFNGATGSSFTLPSTTACLTATSPNNVYLRGGQSSKQIFVAKYDLNGAVKWIKPIYSNSCQDGEGLGISASYRHTTGANFEKNVYLTGYFEGNSASFPSGAISSSSPSLTCSFNTISGNIGNKTAFVTRLIGSNGNTSWVRSLAVPTNLNAMSIGKNLQVDGASSLGFPTTAAGLYITGDYKFAANIGGTTITNTNNFTLGYIANLNPATGNVVWTQQIIPSSNGDVAARDLSCRQANYDELFALGDFSGNTITSGGVTATNGGGRDVYLLRLTKSTGAVTIVRAEGGTDDQYGYGMDMNWGGTGVGGNPDLFISGGYNNSISFVGGPSFGNYGTTTNDHFMSRYDVSLNNVCATHWDASMILSASTLDACDVAASKLNADGSAYYGGMFLSGESPTFSPIPSLSTSKPISSYIAKWLCCACPAPIISVNRMPGSTTASIDVEYPPCDNTNTTFRLQYTSTLSGLIVDMPYLWGTSPITIGGLDPMQTYRWTSFSMCNIPSNQPLILAKKLSTTDVNNDKLVSFEVFPNPAKQLIYFKTNLNGRLEIYNTLGQLIQQKQIAGSSNADMDVSEIPNGNYICKFLSEGNEVITKKIQIIH